jgi:hypothetical protein
VNRLAECRAQKAFCMLHDQYSGRRDKGRAVQQHRRWWWANGGWDVLSKLKARTLPMSARARHCGRVCTTPTMPWAA